MTYLTPTEKIIWWYGFTTGFFVAKIDIMWLYNGYDNDLGMNQIFLDCTLDVPA